MPNQPRPDTTMNAKALAIPALSVAIGAAYLVAGLVGGQTDLAIAGPVVMVGLAAVLLLVRRRSETVQGLMDRRDERINTLDLRATAATGAILIVTILVAFVVEVARGNSGEPYDWLASVGGVTYVVSLVAFRIRG